MTNIVKMTPVQQLRMLRELHDELTLKCNTVYQCLGLHERPSELMERDPGNVHLMAWRTAIKRVEDYEQKLRELYGSAVSHSAFWDGFLWGLAYDQTGGRLKDAYPYASKVSA